MKKVFLNALALIFSLSLFAQQDTKEKVYFDSDDFSLSVEATQILDQLCAIVNKNSTISLKAFTDADGTVAYNLALSKNRCTAVYNYFLNKGFDAGQFKVLSYGESNPVATNNDENGKRLNRRVEIIISTLNQSNEPVISKQAQKFIINSHRDTTLICKEGTKLLIYANSLEATDIDKTEPSQLTITVQEFYKLCDILLANLSTQSSHQLLETGGMLNITASNENVDYQLKEGERMEISFPTKTLKEGMQLFNGKWQNPHHMQWTEDSLNKMPIYSVAEEMPVFAGGEGALFTYLQRSIVYPKKSLALGIEGTVYVSFIIDEKGAVKNPSISKGVTRDLNDVAIDVVSKMPRWTPARNKGKKVKIQYTLPVKFTLLGGDGLVQNNYFKDNSFSAKDTSYESNETSQNASTFVINAKTLDAISQDEVLYYVLNTSKLGWINCDRFVNKSPKTTFKVSLNYSLNSDVKIIFDNYYAVLNGEQTAGVFSFKEVPLGEKITIVATKQIDHKKYLAIKESTISKDFENSLDFKEVTEENYIAEIKKLDKFK